MLGWGSVEQMRLCRTNGALTHILCILHPQALPPRPPTSSPSWCANTLLRTSIHGHKTISLSGVTKFMQQSNPTKVWKCPQLSSEIRAALAGNTCFSVVSCESGFFPSRLSSMIYLLALSLTFLWRTSWQGLKDESRCSNPSSTC